MTHDRIDLAWFLTPYGSTTHRVVDTAPEDAEDKNHREREENSSLRCLFGLCVSVVSRIARLLTI